MKESKKSNKITVESMVRIDTGEYVPLDSLDVEEQRKHMRRVNLMAAEAIASSKGLEVVVTDRLSGKNCQ